MSTNYGIPQIFEKSVAFDIPGNPTNIRDSRDRPKRNETKRNQTKRPRNHQRMTLRGIFRIWILTVRGFFQNDEPDSPRFHRMCQLDSWMQVFLMVNTVNTYLTNGVRMICQALMRSKICVFFVWKVDPLLPQRDGWLVFSSWAVIKI